MEENREFTWRILFIEDDPRQVEGVSDFLRPNGFTVDQLVAGENPLTALAKLQPHAVLLDVMLPGDKDGFDILRDIRAKSDIPVIMVSARGSDVDKVVGLEMGGDDYIAKPFNPYELLARIRAVLRRRSRQDVQSPPSKKIGTTLVSGDFSLDYVCSELAWRDKKTKITSTETNILKALMGHPNQTVERERLLQLAFGNDCNVIDRTVDVHVSHLRSTIRNFSKELSPIRTVWRVGYCWISHE
jgi:two-component system phosphate regulon response regulator OmpR